LFAFEDRLEIDVISGKCCWWYEMIGFEFGPSLRRTKPATKTYAMGGIINPATRSAWFGYA